MRRSRWWAVATIALVLASPAVAGAAIPVGTVTEFPLAPRPASLQAITASITLGPDGNLWFTADSTSTIGRINPSTGVVTEFPTGIPNARPMGIVTGPDGNLWFTEMAGNAIGVMDTSGNVLHEYPLPNPSSTPIGITVGPDCNLWFTEGFTSARIGKITIDGVITEYPTPSIGANWITAGPDGKLWFSEMYPGIVNNVATSDLSGNVTEYPLTAGSLPQGITVGPDGNLWVAQEGTGFAAARVTTGGSITEFPGLVGVPGAFGIAAGPDGNLWLTFRWADAIVQANTSGVPVNPPFVLSGDNPTGITVGPDANMWFAEYVGQQIGRIGTGVDGPVPPLATETCNPRADDDDDDDEQARPAATVSPPVVAEPTFTG